jgi:hypothetical protein
LGATSLGAMVVELLFWDGCPSYDQARAELESAMAELGLDPADLVVRQIDTTGAALGEGFPGSPTIRVDGRDVQPTDDPAGLTCRVYRMRDGRYSPTPDPADVRDALRAALDFN